MKMKTIIILILLLFISSPTVSAKKILRRKKIDPVTIGIVGALFFFIGLKTVQAWRIYKRGQKAKELAIQIIKQMNAHNEISNHIINSCRNAQKIYDLKMNQLVKMERIFIKVKLFNKLKGRIHCRKETDLDQDYGNMLETRINKIQTELDKAISSHSDPNNSQEPKINSLYPTKQMREDDISEGESGLGNAMHNHRFNTHRHPNNNHAETPQEKLVCMILNIEPSMRELISKMTEMAVIDTTNICSSNLLPYLSESFASANRKLKFIKDTETVLKKSNNFAYRLFFKKSYEHLSENLNLADLSTNTKTQMAHKIHEINKLEKRWKYTWKDAAIGICRGGAELALVAMSVQGAFDDFAKFLKQAAIFASVGTFKDVGDYIAGKRVHHSEKQTHVGVDIGATVNLTKYLDGIEWFGVGRIIHDIIQLTVTLVQSRSYSSRVDKQLGGAFSSHDWETRQFYRFSNLKQFGMAYHYNRMETMVNNLDQLTKTIQYHGAVHDSTHLTDILVGEHFKSFRMRCLIKEFLPLGEDESDSMNKGMFFNTFRFAFDFGEAISYLKDGYEILEEYLMGPNALEEVKDIINVEHRYYKKISNVHYISDKNIPFVFPEMKSPQSKRDIYELTPGYRRQRKNKSFYILARRGGENAKGQVTLFYTLLNKKLIQTDANNVDSSFKQNVEAQLLTKIKSEMIAHYNTNCGYLHSLIPLTSLITNSTFKLKILYDNYFGYLKVSKEEYERPENRNLLECYNKFKSADFNLRPMFKENDNNNEHSHQLISQLNKDILQDQKSFYIKTQQSMNYYRNELDEYVFSILYGKNFKSLQTKIGTVFIYQKSDLAIKPDEIVTGQELVSFLGRYYRKEMNQNPGGYSEVFSRYFNDGIAKLSKLGLDIKEHRNGPHTYYSFEIKNNKTFESNLESYHGRISMQEDIVEDNRVVRTEYPKIKIEDLLQVVYKFRISAIKHDEKDHNHISGTFIKQSEFEPFQAFRGIKKSNSCEYFRQLFKTVYRSYFYSRVKKTQYQDIRETFIGSLEYAFPQEHRVIAGTIGPATRFSLKENLTSCFKMEENDYVFTNVSNTEQGAKHCENTIGFNFIEQLSGCKYASLSTKIDFHGAAENPKFVVYPSEYDIEVGVEENTDGEIEVEPFIIASYTLVQGKDGSTVQSHVQTTIVEELERRYYGMGFIKLKNSKEGNFYEFKIYNPKRDLYVKVNFWMKVDEKKYHDFYFDMEERNAAVAQE